MIRWLIAVLTALPLASWVSGQPANGVVNVYSARHYDVDDSLFRAFTSETGIKVNLIEGKSDELLARIRREGELSPADVFIAVDAGRLHRAETQGVFQSVASDRLDALVPEHLRHPDGLWYGLTVRARVLVVAQDRVPSNLKLSYEDLTDPAWRGRVLVRSSSNIYNQSLVAAMIETIGVEATEAWCSGLVENFARKPQGGDTDQIRAVAAGEGDVAIVNHYYLARLIDSDAPADREAASRVRLVFPNQDGRGTHVNICGGGVVKTAPNRANAIRFLEFLADEAAQSAFAAANKEFPASESVEVSSTLREFGPFQADRVNASSLGINNAEAVRVMDRAGWR
ncbi:MAG: Fe(3+) ABC transporter substrate-binding protein [Planctomycetota bacterium]